MPAQTTYPRPAPVPIIGHSPLWNGLVRSVAVLFLLLQLLVPSLASAAKGEWIEICSEYGVTLVQIDFDDADAGDDVPCPDCQDCVFCAATLPELAPTHEILLNTPLGLNPAKPMQSRAVPNPNRRLRPETRGPPPAPQIKTDRAPCAFIASFQSKGGAL